MPDTVVADDETEDNLRRIGANLAHKRRRLAATWGDAREAAVEAVAAGKSQHHVARLLGVDRMTIRKWLGEK